MKCYHIKWLLLQKQLAEFKEEWEEAKRYEGHIQIHLQTCPNCNPPLEVQLFGEKVVIIKEGE